jgi:hypothetical protein
MLDGLFKSFSPVSSVEVSLAGTASYPGVAVIIDGDRATVIGGTDPSIIERLATTDATPVQADLLLARDRGAAGSCHEDREASPRLERAGAGPPAPPDLRGPGDPGSRSGREGPADYRRGA